MCERARVLFPLRTANGSGYDVPPGEFVEVFVDTPLSVAEERDVKGFYAEARSGQIEKITRIDSPYEPQETTEIHIDTTKYFNRQSCRSNH